ncbi:hypothetical protein [Hymenobacter canadensis]|uniref:Uncharacterized protein n=1 Tax=Hymenobacter canadensis TaxID=2999067 RepID=A0ABY7LUJ2_9BACT|nr:hypothetical protein [Hymenobacter canadensis]WBA43171.1 hypothetical protein O3303_06300 [Hymenobacter canadensis]
MAAKLLRLQATLRTSSASGSNLDNDSKMTVKVHYINQTIPLAIYDFIGKDGQGGSTREGDQKIFDITLKDSSLTRDGLNGKAEIEMRIDAVGRDHYAGGVAFLFFFDDGSTALFGFGNFAIGTFHESNTTNQVIRFV